METRDTPLRLIDYLDIVWKRRRLILIPTLLIAAVTAAVSFMVRPKWDVDAIFLPGRYLFRTEQGQFEELVVFDPKQIAGLINQKSFDAQIAAKLQLNERDFPKLVAENLRDTKLVRVVITDADIPRAKSILQSLFEQIKAQVDKKIDIELKTIDSKITSLEKGIEKKKIDIQSKEIEKSRTKERIVSAVNKQRISEQRCASLSEEMKSVKTRAEEIEQQQKKSLEGKKEGIEAIGLLLYSNEIQQNLRYFNSLEEKLSDERVAQENMRLIIKEGEDEIRQLSTDGERLRNEIGELENQTTLLNEQKARIDYAQLVKAPTSSLHPESPRKARNTLLAGFLALVVFLAFAFMVEYVQKQKPKDGRREGPPRESV